MKYKYLISYFYELSDGDFGYGHTEITSTKKFKTYKQIEEVCSEICKNNIFSEVIILNYNLMDKKFFGKFKK